MAHLIEFVSAVEELHLAIAAINAIGYGLMVPGRKG